MSWQLQPDPELGRKAPLSPLAENTTCVVPELAEVPVLRTVKVQVPLGVEVVPGSCRATNGDPPSLSDMLRSTAGSSTRGVSMDRVLCSAPMVPLLGLDTFAVAYTSLLPAPTAMGNVSGGSDPPAGTAVPLVQVRTR